MSKLKHLIIMPALAIVGVVNAGTVYTMTEKAGNSTDKVKLSVEGESLRMDQSSSDAVVFNGAMQHALNIDHGKRSYILIDRQEIAKTVEQLNPALERMRQELANMPPDQRAMVEKMMGGKMPSSKSEPPKWDIAATGETDSQAGIDCEWHDISLNGKLSQRLCMADPDKVTGGRAALNNMRAMAEFFDDVFSQIREQMPFALPQNPMSNVNKVDGFPIITQQVNNGVVQSDLRLDSAESVALGRAVFEAPEGYSQKRLGTR